jgi:hypothetical protein
MFPISDPQFQLDLYHHRSAELRRNAADYRLAREAVGRRRRFGRWPRASARPRPAQTPVTQ